MSVGSQAGAVGIPTHAICIAKDIYLWKSFFIKNIMTSRILCFLNETVLVWINPCTHERIFARLKYTQVQHLINTRRTRQSEINYWCVWASQEMWMMMIPRPCLRICSRGLCSKADGLPINTETSILQLVTITANHQLPAYVCIYILNSHIYTVEILFLVNPHNLAFLH